MNNMVLFIPENITEMSDETIARFFLYNQKKNLAENNTYYSAAFCSNYNCDLPSLLQKGRMFTCIFDNSTPDLPEGALYLQGARMQERVLGYKLGKDETIESPGQLMDKLVNGLDDFPCITAEKEKVYPISEEEKLLTEAEMLDTAAAFFCGSTPCTAVFEKEWNSYISDGTISEEVSVIKTRAAGMLCEKADNILRFGTDNICVDCIKMCEDGSGDVIIRIHESQGRDDTHSFIMSDIYDMGFRFDIMAYETKTFRINSDGMVRETNLAEGIIPFTNFEW